MRILTLKCVVKITSIADDGKTTNCEVHAAYLRGIPWDLKHSIIEMMELGA